MTKTGRYEITVRLGRKILDRRFYNDYNTAMDELDFLEENRDKLYAIGSSVEFRDLRALGPASAWVL